MAMLQGGGGGVNQGALLGNAIRTCAREPIHIPGAIQPHGVLLALQEPELTVLQASVNCAELCGWKVQEALGARLPDLLPEAAADILQAVANPDEPPTSPLRVVTRGRLFDLLLHRNAGLLIVELEPVTEFADLTRYHRPLQLVFARMRATENLRDLYATMSNFIGQLTGYERVMTYKFDEDWHGEVVGEYLGAPVDSYLGHHFPASDIPEQARKLYSTSWLRSIPDAGYEAVPLEPLLNPLTAEPTDLSFSSLRSVSPVHLEYLRNMDVGASMSISLMVDGRLWGLVACHHRKPHPLNYGIRAACELFAQVASLEVAAKQEHHRLKEHVRATTIQTRFFDVLAGEQNFLGALIKYTPDLLEFMGATGAVIFVNGQTTKLGEVPPARQVNTLIDWLKSKDVSPLVFTDSLSKQLPDFADCMEVASGMLAIKLSSVEHNYVLWFRPEVISTVTWAGKPQDTEEIGEKIHPRKSFTSWTQTVRGRSKPWSETELIGARELRSALNALVLRRNEHLLAQNAELERKNTDLNSFAFIASHDLREPLRGISNYTTFLMEDYGEALQVEARRKLEVIASLADRSEQLLNALSQYSRIGRIAISAEPVDLNTLLDEVLESLMVSIEESAVEIRQPLPLPTVKCDAILLREVYANLILNAIRYNKSEHKWVELGARASEEDGAAPVLYVRDNGIGIHEKHFENVFKIFRRLHLPENFGGGTGTGLAIVKSIVERHQGKVWIESVEGEGTTFLFTL